MLLLKLCGISGMRGAFSGEVASTGEALFPGYIGKFSRLHSKVYTIVAAPGLRPTSVRCRRSRREDLACA
jgi:hypothetical protein